MGKAFDTFANREKLIKLHLMQINKQKTQMLCPYTVSSVFHSKQATPSGFEKCTGDPAPVHGGSKPTQIIPYFPHRSNRLWHSPAGNLAPFEIILRNTSADWEGETA